MRQTRVGIGFDIHKLAKGRQLYLGGAAIPFAYGLKGHSDADVLLHALCDALLGALARPDIGQLFPDTDPAFKNKRSTYFLQSVKSIMKKERYLPLNIDCVIIADAPKLQQHYAAIRASLSRLLGIRQDLVGVKAKTTEGILSYSGKGIAVYCVVLLEKRGGRK